MPTQQLILEMEARVKGEREVVELQEAIQDWRKAILGVGPAINHTQAQVEAFAQKVAPLRARIEELNQEMRRTSNLDGGRALMEFARGAEDAQYGIQGVLNNIPQFVQAIGGPSGIVGAVSIASVVLYQLYQHWDDLANLFGMGHTMTEAERMEALGKATEKTAAETLRLLNYERQRAAVKAIDTLRPAKDEAISKEAREAIVNAPAGKLVAGLQETGFIENTPDLANAQKGRNDAQKARDKAKAHYDAVSQGLDFSAKAEAKAALDNADHKLHEAKQKYEKALDDAAKETLAAAINDKEALKALVSHMEKNPQVFPKEVTDELKKSLDAKTPREKQAEAKAESDRKKAENEAKQADRQRVAEADRRIARRDPGLDEYLRDQLEQREDSGGMAAAQAMDELLPSVTQHLIALSDGTLTLEEAQKKAREELEKAQGRLNKANEDIARAAPDKQKKMNEAEEREAERAKREAERQHNQDVAEGKRAIDRRDPGLGDRLQAELGLREMRGQSPEQAARAMEAKLADMLKQLSGGKLNDEDARKLAKERLEDAQGDLNKSVYDRMMNPEQGERKVVEISGIRDFVDKIQSGFGNGNTPEKQLKVQEQIRDILAAQKTAAMTPVWQ